MTNRILARPQKPSKQTANNLTASDISERLSYDPLTGIMRWKRARVAARIGTEAGWVTLKGYSQVQIDGAYLYCHRLAWLLTHGEWPKGEIDHINGDKTDNRIENLRDVDGKTNRQNIRKSKINSSTGLLGVHPHQGAFKAEICIDGKNIHLGVFSKAIDGHKAYVMAKRELHQGSTI